MMDDLLVLDLSDGFKITVPNSLYVSSTYIFLELDTWFEEEPAFLKSFLQPGMRVIDIGANYGYYTNLASKRLGPSGKIWAFEPGKDTAALLHNTLALNQADNVKLFEAGLGDAPGNAWLTNLHSSEFNEVLTEFQPDANPIIIESLDNLALTEDFSGLDFIKLDAEGFEEKIIHGAAKLLEREDPLILLEVSIGLDAIGLLESKGYKQYRLIKALNCLVPFDVDAKRVEDTGIDCMNLMFCKAGRAAMLHEAGLLLTQEDTERQYPPADIQGFIDYYRNIPAVKADPALLAAAGNLGLCHPEYLNACAEYILMRNPELSVGERYCRLIAADLKITALYFQDNNFYSGLATIRIYSDFGRTGLIGNVITQLLHHPEIEKQTYPTVPFLPVSLLFENLPVRSANIQLWFICMLVWKIELTTGPSSTFTPDNTNNYYNILLDAGYLIEAMERRAGLSGLMWGKDLPPQPQFIDKGPRLNAEIWQKLARLWREGYRNIDVII
jgi:FkbM family methyltransferase